MTIKLDDKEQREADLRALEAVAEEIQAERRAAQDKLYNDIIEVIPDSMDLVDVSGVFIKLFVVGVIQGIPRDKAAARNAVLRVAGLLPKAFETEWGSPSHQGLLAHKSKEVN